MIITDNSKIILLTCHEIKNILKSLYGLNYSASVISKIFITLDAGIRVGKTDYIAEEFIQYLFFRRIQNPLKTKVKIAQRKKEILKDINPELLESGLMTDKAKDKEVFASKADKRAKKLERALIELELLRKIKQKKCLFCKHDQIFKKVDEAKKNNNILDIKDLFEDLITLM